ncbi:MAG TPA: type IV pilin [Xanthomonadaceae bacterium]|nr:type IV pilin [Xanthomonadaceae bacterium]
MNKGISQMKFGSSSALSGFRSRGFTLIELMVVVAIIAILAAIAYPAYQDFVRKGRRGQAKADLVEYAQVAERFRTINNTYIGFDAGGRIASQSPRQGTAWYQISLDGDATRSSFKLQAVPQGAQEKDKCGTLTINQAGVKTNSKGNLADCW